MSRIRFTYEQQDEEMILRRAKELGYKEIVADETLLVDGKIPMVQATDNDGNPLVEMDYEYAEDPSVNPGAEPISSTPRLDENGNTIPVMEQMDIRIPNPQTPVQFISIKAKEAVAKLLTEGIEKQIVDAATIEAERIVKKAKATAKATKEAVVNSIQVEVE